MALAWFSIFIVMSGIGFTMILTKKYRGYVNWAWFRDPKKETKEIDERITAYIIGPVYIIGGLFFLALGLESLGLLNLPF